MFLTLKGTKNGPLDFTQDLVKKTFYEQNMKENIRNMTLLPPCTRGTKALDGGLSGSQQCVCKPMDPVFLSSD